jgi:hypothetical protein
MKIPGFNAEASLYRESGHYLMAAAHTRADGAIQPAIDPKHGGTGDPYGDCIEACRADCLPTDHYCSPNCDCLCRGGPRWAWPPCELYP